MCAFLSFCGDVGVLAWLPSLFSPQHPDRWCCLQWLGRTSFSERIWNCAWLCSERLWVGCTERRSLWVLISVPPLTSQGHQASHFLSTFGLLHPPYGANDTPCPFISWGSHQGWWMYRAVNHCIRAMSSEKWDREPWGFFQLGVIFPSRNELCL